MSLLNEESKLALIEKLNTEANDDSDSYDEEVIDSTQPEESEEDNSSVEAEVKHSSEEAAPRTEAVPYKRFKKVIEERNQIRDSMDAMKREMAELKSLMQGSTPPPASEGNVTEEDLYGDYLDEHAAKQIHDLQSL